MFNAEPSCTTRTDRDPDCSLGLAIDPQRPYTADNVVPTRVWQGDELAVDCLLAHGIPIIDEGDAWSPQWFRVRLAGRLAAAHRLAARRTHEGPPPRPRLPGARLRTLIRGRPRPCPGPSPSPSRPIPSPHPTHPYRGLSGAVTPERCGCPARRARG